MAKLKILSLFALCGSLLALGVIGLGAFTRLIDAGLGCPDWPGCYGHLTVPLTEMAKQFAASLFPESPLVAYKAWAEMIHRYFVGGLSIFILLIIGLIFFIKSLRTRTNLILALSLILLLVYQILLGRWTVTLQLLPIIVSQHLLGGFAILSVLWLIFLINSRAVSVTVMSSAAVMPAKAGIQKQLRITLYFAWIALFILILQISLGAWTSTNYASLSCPDFPFCNNNTNVNWQFNDAFQLFRSVGINYEGGVLSEAARQTIQMSHRVMALIFTLYILVFMLIVFVNREKMPAVLKDFYILLGLIVIQSCLGISNVIFKLPLMTAISHTIVAALLLLTLISFIWKLTIAQSGQLKYE